jgi:hypothetical protein
MAILQFKDKLIIKLKEEPIPDNIFGENNFEQNFVFPQAIEVNKTETDVYLFSHPWGNKVHCAPNCESAAKGDGHREDSCEKCWNESKSWGTVKAFGTKHNFDLLAKDDSNKILAIEIKFIIFKNEGRKPNGEIQRFLGQCLLAKTKFDFVIGICGYRGTLEPEYNEDLNVVNEWAKNNNIDLVFRPVDR